MRGASLLKLSFNRRDTVVLYCRVRQNGEPVNITGWKFRLTVKKSPHDDYASAMISKYVDTHDDPTGGDTSFLLDADDTDIDDGAYHLDIQLENTLEQRRSILGTLRVFTGSSYDATSPASPPPSGSPLPSGGGVFRPVLLIELGPSIYELDLGEGFVISHLPPPADPKPFAFSVPHTVYLSDGVHTEIGRFHLCVNETLVLRRYEFQVKGGTAETAWLRVHDEVSGVLVDLPANSVGYTEIASEEGSLITISIQTGATPVVCCFSVVGDIIDHYGGP